MSSSAQPILTLTNTQAKELAGRMVTVGAESYYFKSYDPKRPGQPPWRSGAEGKAFPLLDVDRSVAAYMKFFTRPTQKRLDRTAWLIAQQMHTWLPALAAAPMVWGDSRHDHRPDDAPFDLAGYLARAVPGTTWLELKTSINDNSSTKMLRDDFRWRCARDLLLALAVLEQEGIQHGDLSPNNIVVDVDARPDQPALYLIDFDAFVAPSAGEGRAALSVVEGGTFGTEGYCPPELAAAAVEGDGSVAPRTDRYGRDMLLLELLVMDCGLSPDDPPALWDIDHLNLRWAALRARSQSMPARLIAHLDPSALFHLADEERPTSVELAAELELRPARRPPRHLSRVRAVAPVVLGQPVSAVGSCPLARQWGHARPGVSMLPVFVPWRWTRPEANPYNRSLWQDIRAALIFAIPFLILILIGILSAIFGKR